MNKDEKKEAIRAEVLTKLKETRKDFRETSRIRIQKSLLLLPRFQNAHVVSVYVAKDNEVGTSGIFGSLWNKGNRVVLAPRIHGKALEMCEVHSPGDFVQGPYGLRQPACHIVPYAGKIDVVIIPGLAFDERGARLGRGKGYYDRFLETTDTCAIALAYDFQVLPRLPENAEDKRMDFVITEKRIIRGKKNDSL